MGGPFCKCKEIGELFYYGEERIGLELGEALAMTPSVTLGPSFVLPCQRLQNIPICHP